MSVAWLGQHWFAIALALVYTAFLLLHARAGMRVGKTAAGFFVGNRRLGGAVIGVSFYATFASTNSYIGLAGKSYEYGLPWLTMAAMLVVFCWLSWRVVAPRMRRFAAAWGSLTVPDFLAVRFASDRVRIAAAVVIVFSSLLYLVAVFKGAGNLLQVFLGIPYQVAVIVTLVLIVAYTMLGGFLSVVRTDVLQGSLMVVGSLLLFYFITSAAGGVTAIAELPNEPSRAHLFDLNAAIPFVVLVGIALAGSLKLMVDPRQVTRFYGLKDERSVRVGIWVAVLGILVIQFCLFPLGLYAHFLLDGVSDTDLVIPTLVNDAGVIPPLVGDFLVIAILAAAMSSLDSVLLVAASVASRDLFDRRNREAARRCQTRPGRRCGVCRRRGGRGPQSTRWHRGTDDLLRQPVRGLLRPDDPAWIALAPRKRGRCARRVRHRHRGTGGLAPWRTRRRLARGLSGAFCIDTRLCGCLRLRQARDRTGGTPDVRDRKRDCPCPGRLTASESSTSRP